MFPPCWTCATWTVSVSGSVQVATFPPSQTYSKEPSETGHLSEWCECILTSAGHRDWGHFPWLFQLHSWLRGAESTMNVILLMPAGRALSIRPLAFNHVELWMCYQSLCLPWSREGWITQTFFLELDFKVDRARIYILKSKVYSESPSYLKIGRIIGNNICSSQHPKIILYSPISVGCVFYLILNKSWDEKPGQALYI